MIRRRVEYIIVCDCERVFGYAGCDGCANAFNCDTAADCAAVAESEGWQRLSARLWLSPKCAEVHERTRIREK